MTWSWFGTMAGAETTVRREVTQWLHDHVGISLHASDGVAIDQWARVPHPNAPGSPNGPSSMRGSMIPGGALMYIEAKWNASLGTGEGNTDEALDDQVVLRRDSFRKHPALRYDQHLRRARHL